MKYRKTNKKSIKIAILCQILTSGEIEWNNIVTPSVAGLLEKLYFFPKHDIPVHFKLATAFVNFF